MVIACSGGAGPPLKLVSFLCKGGSGKTAAAAVAAQYYASEGFKTCLAMKPQDPTAEQLMGFKIGNSLTEFATNLSAIKLLTSKMLFEPLDRLKKADARANFTQGVLEGVLLEACEAPTDIGRLASPSLLKQLYDAARPNGKTSEGRLSTEIWNEIEHLIEYRRGSELLIEAGDQSAS